MKTDRLKNTLLDKDINRKIEAFRLLYELKTFSQVAQTMNCSLSTISNLISDLEYYCGTKLLERHGKNGIFITPAGEGLYQKTNNWKKNITGVFVSTHRNVIENNNLISVFSHPLFANYYFMNFTNIHSTDWNKLLENITFHITVGDKIQVNEHLRNGVDVVIFPFEWGDVGRYQDEYDVYSIKPYDLYLYMNKHNKYANLDNKAFTWDILADANIMPNNRQVMFKTASELIHESSHLLTTDAFDLYFLYQGVCKNMWSVAIGGEFEKIFDCHDFVRKSHQLAPKIQFATYWMILTKKDNCRRDILFAVKNAFAQLFDIAK